MVTFLPPCCELLYTPGIGHPGLLGKRWAPQPSSRAIYRPALCLEKGSTSGSTSPTRHSWVTPQGQLHDLLVADHLSFLDAQSGWSWVFSDLLLCLPLVVKATPAGHHTKLKVWWPCWFMGSVQWLPKDMRWQFRLSGGGTRPPDSQVRFSWANPHQFWTTSILILCLLHSLKALGHGNWQIGIT